jgi:hypothetical protein
LRFRAFVDVLISLPQHRHDVSVAALYANIIQRRFSDLTHETALELGGEE